MRKKKTGIKVSRTNATSANLAKPSKPKHRCKRLLIVCGVVVVLVGLAIAGDDYLIVGDDHLQFPWLEEMYHRECGGKTSSTKKEQVSAEEKCLRSHIERIFGKDAEFGVEFRLCEKDGVNKRSFADLSQVMRICKEKTAGMTEDQIFYANDGLDHSTTCTSMTRTGSRSRLMMIRQRSSSDSKRWLNIYPTVGRIACGSDTTSKKETDTLVVVSLWCQPRIYPPVRTWSN